MSGESVLLNADAKMRKAVDVLKHELSTVRTGRAHPGLVEHIMVDYHGTPVPLNQIAGISVPEARLLVIQPWDKSVLPNVEKAILKSDLGLNPHNDGNIIRLAIPQLTEERRTQLVKMVRKKVEDGKVAVRNVRRDALEGLRKLKDDKEMTEDEQKRALGRLQQLTDKFVEEIDRIAKAKESELMEF
ncbi:MAG: ribosome recycling factor [Chloroflexi bacterium RBG_13_52_14]|jgi:ribosome recycling factor|nr:MAG: ribosome recycling factor [Chloroflexi bacterium RBG_13_52_14]